MTVSDARLRTERLQTQASDPEASAWVTANAGSGKTTVLVRRVLRLMLDGIDPGRILCLTYTKAAAANMANRLFDLLATWVGLDDGDLDAELARILSRAATPTERVRARRLFAEALETPGGLKIETIHAFCTRVLQSAPFEAGIPAHFSVISETDRANAIEAAVMRTLNRASANGSELRAALDRIGEAVDEQSFRDLIDEAMGASSFLRCSDGTIRTAADLRGMVAEALCIDPDVKLEALLQKGLARCERVLPLAELATAILTHGTSNERSRWAPIAGAHGAATTAEARFGAWRKAYLTKKDEPLAHVTTNGVLAAVPDLAPRIAETAALLGVLLDEYKAALAFTRSTSLFELTRVILADYAATKHRLATLDFADLISCTRALFENVDAAWLIYKLDAGLSHVLVDEAQDTSRDQWAIFNTLTSEFLAGSGQHAAERTRTVFAVGDPKQSIFGFQGAAPAEFGQQRRELKHRVPAGGGRFHDVSLQVSFRSTEDIMAAVDAVFAQPLAFKGLEGEPGETGTVHETTRRGETGAVDLWDLFETDEGDDREVWRRPPDAPERAVAVLRMARAIARTLKTWTDAGQDDMGRPFRPGDALILMPKRRAAFGAVVRELKRLHVPVAGMDRLKLAVHVAVEDLLALGQTVLLPDDDLTLAEVLKGPLFDFDDDDLIRIAPHRTGSLRAALATSGHERDRSAEAELIALAELAGRHGPFGFYSTILSVRGGRRRMMARLGAEAADAIDAFLARALEHEQREGPSLARFLSSIAASADDVKRDLAAEGDEVRVMTVHGAKGLEAPVVFIADIGAPPGATTDNKLIALPRPGRNDDEPVSVWSPRVIDDSAVIRTARARARDLATEEHHRLLYVALTRARDRLILCGVRPAKDTKLHESWYGLVESGLAASTPGLVRIEPNLDGTGRRRFKITPEATSSASPAIEASRSFALPDWVHAPLPPDIAVRPPLAPAHALDAAERDDTATEPATALPVNSTAAERGRLAHLLLQWLPEVTPHLRASVAARLVARQGGRLSAAERAALVDETLAVLADDAVGSLFGPDGLAEVEIGGEISVRGGRRAVSGRIDRLLVTDSDIIFADFKTTPRVPKGADGIAPSTLAQMAVYRALLAQLYPGRRLRALVVYTAGPLIHDVPELALDTALAAITER